MEIELTLKIDWSLARLELEIDLRIHLESVRHRNTGEDRGRITVGVVVHR